MLTFSGDVGVIVKRLLDDSQYRSMINVKCYIYDTCIHISIHSACNLYYIISSFHVQVLFSQVIYWKVWK